MSFSWFLALRYLKPKRSFISVITIISVLGVALGVGVLVVVISVMSGFDKRIKEEILKYDEPLKLIAPRYNMVIGPDGSGSETGQPEWQRVMADVQKFSSVVSVSPVIQTTGLLDRKMTQEEQETQDEQGMRPAVVESFIRGIDPSDAAQMERLHEYMADGEGKVDLDGASIILTKDLQNRLGVFVRQEMSQDLDTPLGGQDDSAVLAYGPHFLASWQQRHKDDKALGEVESSISGFGGVPWREHEKAVRAARSAAKEEKKRKAAEANGGNPPEEEETGSDEAEDEAIPPPVDPEGVTELAALRKRETLLLNRGKEPAPEELQLTGVMMPNRISRMGFVSLSTAQAMSGAGVSIDHLAITLKDPYRAGEVKNEILATLPPGWDSRTWMEENKRFFDAIANERGMMYLVLCFIIVVAAFCIMNTTIVMAVQKRREIGMMSALGAKTSQIIGLFTGNGAIIGLMGVTLGYGLGNIFLHYRNGIRNWIGNTFNWQVFDPRIYGVNTIPSEARWEDHLFICLMAFALCTVAALIPAWFVARLDPARALRTDR